MNIVNCKSEDLEACSKLFIKVYEQGEYNEEWEEEDAYHYLERFHTIDSKQCFLALNKDEIIGAIFSYTYPWQGKSLVYVQELFVLEAERNKGIAKALLSSIVKNKTINIWLVANEKTGASSFYEKIGLKKDSPYKFHYGQIEN